MITAKNVDLSNCDREQIQFVGAIQPVGVMLVVQEPELRIVQVSRNAEAMLGLPLNILLGAAVGDLLDTGQMDRLTARLKSEGLAGSPVHMGRIVVAGGEFDLLAHRHDQVLILELESRSDVAFPGVSDLYSNLRGALANLQATTSLQSFFDLAVKQLRAFLKFDRVMIYKFLEDGRGWVRAEDVAEGLEPFLGLHYPASDIPEPARRLFSLTWVRHQPSVPYKPVPMKPEYNPVTGRPLDMGYCFLRSVSAMYSDYLKNMGTRSSLVMNLMKDGKLWGLIACHHHAGPKHVPYEVRAVCEFQAHMVSLLMSAKEDLENYEYRMRLKSVQATMVENIARRGDFVSGFIKDSPSLLDFIAADAAAVVVNRRCTSTGKGPSESELGQIVEWLSTRTTGEIFATDCLSAQMPGSAGFRERCAGVLAIRFSKAKDDFLIWFRRELIQTVSWAGDPHKPVDITPDGRLRPRTSFALWKEKVQLKSAPWSELEMEAATALRASILELILRRAEEMGRYADLERSHSELDSFAYVASHELREPLLGINSYAQMLMEDYSDRIDAEGQEKLITLGRLSQRMDHLLDSLLEYSRVGRTELPHAQVDLNQVVKEALFLLQARLRGTGAKVRISEPLPVITGDYDRLVEVFTNLISNAVKYNDKASIEVEIGFEVGGNGVPVFCVRDNGIGIEKNHYQDIFRIFRRLHVRDAFGGGSGAGLTITKKIIERHSGRIWVESTPNQGSTFLFTLGQADSRE